MRSPRLAERYGIIWRSKKSSSADSESASVAAITFAGGAAAGVFAIGCATVAGGGFSPGAAAEAAIGVGGATAFGSTDGGAPPVIFSVPAGTGAPSGTRAVGVPIVSGGFVSGGRGGGIFSAMLLDPTALFARAAGVLKSAAVEAIGADPAATVCAGLAARPPAS